MVIWFPLRKVRSKSECAYTMRVGMVLVVRPYVHHIYIYIYNWRTYKRVRGNVHLREACFTRQLTLPANTFFYGMKREITLHILQCIAMAAVHSRDKSLISLVARERSNGKSLVLDCN